ncbi:hypothetical protein ACTWQF_05845 [Streptomyces sp. 8N114]
MPLTDDCGLRLTLWLVAQFPAPLRGAALYVLFRNSPSLEGS